jgi:hypothetical protein
MGNCRGGETAFDNARAASRPVIAQAMPSRPAERVLYRFAADMMPVQQDTNCPRFDFNDGFSAVLVATFTSNSGIDAHLERGAGAAIDFADLSTRTHDFLTFQSALQDFQINQCIRFRQLVARATDPAGDAITAGTTQYVQIGANRF